MLSGETSRASLGTRMRNDRQTITTSDYHTAGEPFRIVLGGVVEPEGRSVVERRTYAEEHLDDIRRVLVNEPRGHADMYGCFVTPPDDAGADLGAVFFHNAGYSTACGHGMIALVTWALETGRLAGAEPTTTVTLDVPSGRVPTVATFDGTSVSSVRFRNVPAYVHALDQRVTTARGTISCDIAFGGAFYASVDAGALGLEVAPRDLRAFIDLGREIKREVENAYNIVHPTEPHLRDIYGVTFFETATDTPGPSQRNVTVFADGEVDRSPCGSGTSARLAILHAREELAVDTTFTHRSLIDTQFTGAIVGHTDVAGRAAVVTEIGGSAYPTGHHEFLVDPRDPLRTGFLLR